MDAASTKLWQGTDGAPLFPTRQLVALGIAMCLPIPVLAASGLRLPLPAGAYRLASQIVGDTSGLVGHRATVQTSGAVAKIRGTIVLSARERAAQAAPAPVPVAAHHRAVLAHARMVELPHTIVLPTAPTAITSAPTTTSPPIHRVTASSRTTAGTPLGWQETEATPTPGPAPSGFEAAPLETVAPDPAPSGQSSAEPAAPPASTAPSAPAPVVTPTVQAAPVTPEPPAASTTAAPPASPPAVDATTATPAPPAAGNADAGGSATTTAPGTPPPTSNAGGNGNAAGATDTGPPPTSNAGGNGKGAGNPHGK